QALATALLALKRRPSIPLKFAITAGVALALAGWWAADRRTRQERASVASQADSLTAILAKRAGAPAIAVLPLTDLGTEPGSEEFADGFTEEIINSLATNDHLQVRSRTSSFAF